MTTVAAILWSTCLAALLLYPIARGGFPRRKDGPNRHPADRLVTHIALPCYLAWVVAVLWSVSGPF